MINRFHIVRQALTYMKINEGKKSSKTTLVVVGILLSYMDLFEKKEKPTACFTSLLGKSIFYK